MTAVLEPTRTLTLTDPRTGEAHEPVPVAGEQEVRTALATARAAAPGWARTAPAERAAAVRAAADAVRAAADELAGLNTRETGKTPDDSRGGVEAGIGTLEQYAQLGPLHRGRSLQG